MTAAEPKTVTDARPGRASVVLPPEVLELPGLDRQAGSTSRREQRTRLDQLRRARGDSLAELIRTAVDEFLDREGLEPRDALEITFGAVPEAEAAERGEWSGRDGGGG